MKAFIKSFSVETRMGEFTTAHIELLVDGDPGDVLSAIQVGMVVDELTVHDPTVDIDGLLSGHKPKPTKVKVLLPGRKLCLD